MFRKIIFIFLSTLISSHALAQDFSFNEFINEEDSARRVELGVNGASFYRKNNLDSLRVLALTILEANQGDDFSVDKAFSDRYMGSYSIRTGDIPAGIKLLKSAREIFLSLKMTNLLSETENELGNAYYLKGNCNLASRYYFSSLVHGSVTSDKTAGYNGMIGFGKTVCAVGDTTTGLLFIQKYLQRCLRDEKFEAASDACGYLGMIAGLNGKVELMSAYYRRANVYARRSNSKTHLANAFTNKAIDYFYHDRLDSAILFFNRSLIIREEVGATRPIVESLYNLAVLNIELDNFTEAKKYAERGELLSRKAGIKSWQLDCLILLLEIAEYNKDSTEILQFKLDIDRIQKELDNMNALDDNIVDVAAEITSLEEKPLEDSLFWETFAFIVLMLTCSYLLYAERRLV